MSDHIIRVENANLAKVMYYIDKIVSESGRYCDCRGCLQEAAAHALNILPPHYYPGGEETDRRDKGSPWVLIEHAVREALDTVGKNHRHRPDLGESPDYPAEFVA